MYVRVFLWVYMHGSSLYVYASVYRCMHASSLYVYASYSQVYMHSLLTVARLVVKDDKEVRDRKEQGFLLGFLNNEIVSNTKLL